MADDILWSAAVAFENMLQYRYRIILGKKKKSKEIDIHFQRGNFFHLAGFQHLKQRYWSCSDKNIFQKVLSHEFSSNTIKNDSSFSSIYSRLKILTQLEALLDDNNTKFFAFEPKKLSAMSKIKADYLAKCMLNDNDTALVFFLKEKNNDFYIINSVFTLEKLDYSQGQTSYVTVLREKTNLTTRKTQVLFNIEKKQA